ncbi:TetR/AcrR family transcriptional regulator [Demequina soli]|uniref:TetR/AcrR family transcriptional regulator n=1 Tax=Demequina soli TaxID=1638987 RepID=UPI0007865DCE|nr:TetR family transcriptional regulator [Demequina soli]
MSGAAARRTRGRGPRGGGADTRGDILAAATGVFGERGYGASSVREIARRADVDPALVRHYFPTKADLFIEAVRPLHAGDPRISALATVPREELGAAIVGLFLGVWDEPEMARRLRALLASIAESDDLGPLFASVMMRDVLGGLVREDRPELRAQACGSQLVGLAMARYVVRMPAIADAPAEILAALYGPTLQRYLDGDV